MQILTAAAQPVPSFEEWSTRVSLYKYSSDYSELTEILKDGYRKLFIDVVWYENDKYIVSRTLESTQAPRISIRRKDGKAKRKWRDFQDIKNQLWGKDAEAVEVYPAESRLLDTDNVYHLWRVDDVIGFNVGRHVW